MRKILKFLWFIPVHVVVFLRNAKIWNFPQGLRSRNGRFLPLFATSVAGVLSLRAKNKIYTKDSSELMQNPILRFHANYSLTHVESNTPCTKLLATDLASVIDLSDKRILCLGSRNLDEIFQLQLVGARANNITAVDLYSEFPEIVAMDFQDLKFENESFDVVFWAGSYAYASDPMLALSEGLRVVCRPGVFALGDTFLGGATRQSYNQNQSRFMNENKELDAALEELPEGTLLTLGVENLDEMIGRIRMLSTPKIVFTRDYVTIPHYNVIAML